MPKEYKIFYLDELCDDCDPWLRVTRESPWKRVREIRAEPGDRVIIRDVEHIVDADLTRRRLRKGEHHLWKTWDIPLLGHVPDPKVDTSEPIRVTTMKSIGE